MTAEAKKKGEAGLVLCPNSVRIGEYLLKEIYFT